MLSDIANIAGILVGVGSFAVFEFVMFLRFGIEWVVKKICKLCKRKKKQKPSIDTELAEF